MQTKTTATTTTGPVTGLSTTTRAHRAAQTHPSSSSARCASPVCGPRSPSATVPPPAPRISSALENASSSGKTPRSLKEGRKEGTPFGVSRGEKKKTVICDLCCFLLSSCAYFLPSGRERKGGGERGEEGRSRPSAERGINRIA